MHALHRSCSLQSDTCNWPSEQKSTAAVLAWHNQRGQAENFLKELKGGLGLDRMPCGRSFANAVFFRIGLIASNLFIGFKRLASLLLASPHCHLPLEADPGGGADRAPCGTGDPEAGPGCRKAPALSLHPKAVLGAGNHDLKPYQRSADRLAGDFELLKDFWIPQEDLLEILSLLLGGTFCLQSEEKRV